VDRPSVVLPRRYLVDLFPSVLAYLVDEHIGYTRLNVQAERLAQRKRPDSPAGTRGAIEEGVVGRDGAVAVDAQDLAADGAKRLRIGGVGVVFYADVSFKFSRQFLEGGFSEVRREGIREPYS
jgi:hypothetical protein